MNGATADDCAKTIKKLSATSIIKIGASQKRFLVFKNPHNSFKMVILPMDVSFLSRILHQADGQYCCLYFP